MKFVRTLAVCLLAGVCGAAVIGECAVPEGAVALVNGKAVSRAEFGGALAASLGGGAIDEFLDWVLVEQEAAEKGVTVSDAELEARKRLEVELQMSRVFERARMSPEEYRRAAEKHGWDEAEVRRELEEAIPLEALRVHLLAEKLLRPYITITDEHVRRYYDATRAERYSVAHVEVPSERVARSLMEKLQAQPEAWTDAVLRFSLDRASVPYTGRLQPVPVGSKLGQQLEGMKPGELKLYCDGQRWHVIRFIARIPATGLPFENVQRALKDEFYCRRVESRVAPWLARMNERSSIVTNLSPDPRVRSVLGEGVAAFVNGEAVPFSRLHDVLISLYGRKFIGAYIERELVFQQARARATTVSEEAVSQRMSEIIGMLFAEDAAERRVGVGQFEEFLTDSGMPPERYKEERLRSLVSRDDVLATLLAEQIVSEGVRVTADDVRTAYRDHYGERLDVRRVILGSAGKAEDVYKRAMMGADFELLARTESIEPLAWMHGGLVRNVTARHAYFDRVKDLKQGMLSRVFQRRDEYHILKVVARHAPEQAPPLESVRDDLYKEALREKLRLRIVAWLEKLKAEAKIEVAL